MEKTITKNEDQRENILNAAKALLNMQSYVEVSLNAIVKEAGISKPTIYRHFSTKEEIFMPLYLECLKAWIDEILVELEKSGLEVKVSALSDILVRTFFRNNTLLKLAPFVNSMIEVNSSEQALFLFKLNMTKESERLVAKLLCLYPPTTTKSAFIATSYAYAILINYCNVQSNQLLRKVLANPEFEIWQMDLETTLKEGLTILLEGYLTKKGEV